MEFTGFSNISQNFLLDLAKNNNREWFLENKQTYKDYIETEVMLLFSEVANTMQLIDPSFEVEPKPAKVLSRIYRDIRFSKDKTPYRTNVWFSFKRAGREWKEYPAYFFDLSAHSYSYGMGYYQADKNTMDRLRSEIEANPEEVFSMMEYLVQNTNFSIEGDKYKKVLNPNIDERLRGIYQSKNIYLICNRELSDYSETKDLDIELQEQFLMTTEFYQFLNRLV